MLRAHLFRNNQLGQFFADCFGATKTEYALSGGIEFADATVFVNGDDAIERGFQDGAIERFRPFRQNLLQVAFLSP